MPNKTEKLDVLIYGSSGRMGLELCALLANHPQLNLYASVDQDHTTIHKRSPQAKIKSGSDSLVHIVEGAKVIIDFSTTTGTANLTKSLMNTTKKIVLVGTTGLTKKNIDALKKAAKLGAHKILIAGNTSIGIFTLAGLAASAARVMAPIGFDIEITETHHRRKVDAPSGTALLLANIVKNEVPGSRIEFNRSGPRRHNTIGIQSVRGGGVFGEHEIRFISDDEELHLGHRAFSRALFAKGALNLISDIKRGVPAGQARDLCELISK
jgi:4-hydroxy-tetrahydrodipicolinate reductase